MIDSRTWIREARSVIIEHDVAVAIDHLTKRYNNFDETWREVELLLATRPEEVGIQGVACDGIGLRYYLHSSTAKAPRIDVLYRYDKEMVCIESLSIVELSLRLAC
jgi:hypothetical protein